MKWRNEEKRKQKTICQKEKEKNTIISWTEARNLKNENKKKRKEMALIFSKIVAKKSRKEETNEKFLSGHANE